MSKSDRLELSETDKKSRTIARLMFGFGLLLLLIAGYESYTLTDNDPQWVRALVQTFSVFFTILVTLGFDRMIKIEKEAENLRLSRDILQESVKSQSEIFTNSLRAHIDSDTINRKIPDGRLRKIYIYYVTGDASHSTAAHYF